MRGPNGNEFANRGVYLDVVPNHCLVFTDAYTTACEPSSKPFIGSSARNLPLQGEEG